MALFRQIAQHPTRNCWAYIESSDEGGLETILGDKEFETKDEAIEYSKGFEPFSYEWVEPMFTKAKKLKGEKELLISRLSKIEEELLSLQ